MSVKTNEFDQVVGVSLEHWQVPAFPDNTTMQGRFCRLEPLDAQTHAEALYAAYQNDSDGSTWTYLPYGPFTHYEDFYSWLDSVSQTRDPMFFVIFPGDTEHAAGLLSYLRISPEIGCVEMGHVHYADRLKRTPAATEAQYLMMKRIFEHGYRRYEWKCDALNEPSRQAALRLGFMLEGVFRQDRITKGRNRDTAWYSIIDSEWPELSDCYQQWLAAENFDENMKQQVALRDLTSHFREG